MTHLRVVSFVFLGALAFAAAMPSPCRADCVQEVYAADPPTTNPFVFPNWYRAPVAALWLWECEDGDPWLQCQQTVCATGSLKGVTIVNFGTATGGPGNDITGLSFLLSCGSDTALQNMTYAGVWSGKAAWTWAGALAMPADPCDTKSGCWCWPQMFFYTDIGPCPTDGATIELGPGFDSLSTVKGGITDTCNCSAPAFGDAITETRTIKYLIKQASQTTAIPGDTMTFSVFYGKPGSVAINPIIITDTVPAYTHYVFGSGVPPPDSGWDPSATTPMKLRWTLPGPFNPAGGATLALTFQLTVDWGNGDSFEPGSGDIGAPEGYRITNTAHATFVNSACPVAVSNMAQTTVRRFLMWIIGDNDVLFSPTFGQPPDEIIYEVFIKNLSTTKTWYDVRMWDTVPPVLDIWSADCGFDDPCAGWTMTPTGCANASPGRLMNGGNTILTWSLEMPPQFTIGLRFKAKVKNTAVAGNTAINVLSLRAFGHMFMVGGTGDSTVVKNFAHLAPIILPTTYISYVGYSGMQWAQPGDAVIMFPLNKKTQFELRGLTYEGAPTTWEDGQGVSDSIGCLLGNCLGGFPGNLGPCPTNGINQAPLPNTWGGCKAERIPARYEHAIPLSDPYQHIYKITSNSPVDWQAQPYIGSNCGDFITYSPSSTLTYTGLLHYFWKNGYNTSNGSLTAHGTEMWWQNTGKDPYGNVDPTLPTTVHEFQFDYSTNSWVYLNTYELGGESGAMNPGTWGGFNLIGQVGAYRSISSQAQLIVWQGYASNSILGSGCPYYDASAMMPTRDTGNCVGFAGDVFYGLVHGYSEAKKVVILNVGAADATYRVWQYKPDQTTPEVPNVVPSTMLGTSGTWKPKGTYTVPAGFTNANNPHMYAVMGGAFNAAGNAVSKVELLSGGPIEIFHGSRVFVDWGGGGTVHAINGKQTGGEFWFGFTNITDGSGPTHVYRVNLYCPKVGTVVQCESETGISGTYTTTLPDQVVSFGPYAAGDCTPKKNFKYTRIGGSGDMICQWFNDGPEKGFTAPFLQTGVHYAIIMPPTVFVGQSFWITVVVLEQGGETKTDYVGTSSFTSSDPSALLQGVGMENYNYTWVAGDNGVKVFVNVVFNQMGFQSIIAIDTTDGSISGVAATMVVGADVKLEKRKSLTVAASGDTVQFQICWSNYSTATALTFVITDAVPLGTTYIPEVASLALCGWNGPRAPAVTMAYSASTATSAAAVAFQSLGGTSSATSTTRWLRWTIRDVYVMSSGCVCFKVLVE